MKSNKKKKRSNKLFGIFLVLIIIAFVGVFYWQKEQNKYVLSTKSTAKKVAADQIVANYYTVHGQDNKCKDILGDFYIGMYYNEDNHLVMGCAPQKRINNHFTWAGGNKFVVKLKGVKKNDTYTCYKGSKDDKGKDHPMRIYPSGNKIKLYPAKDIVYGNTVCSKDKNYIVYNIDDLEDNGNAGASESASLDGENLQLTGTTTFDSSSIESYNATMTAEADDPQEFQQTDPSILSSAKGEGWETVGSLGNKQNFQTYQNAFYAAHPNEPKADKKGELSTKKNSTYTLYFTGETKEAAQKKDKDKFGKSKSIAMGCNYKLTSADIEAIEKYNRQSLIDSETGKITQYYYDSNNTKYYRGYWQHTDKISIYYKYHYLMKIKKKKTRTVVKEDASFKCKKTCTEIVKVEYGPPVQVDAGMCFEYRMKVSSVTNCTANPDKDVQKPTKPSKIKTCYLAPICGHGLRQAGPNDDFDACVNECDGGKYTESCSNKCYDEVYGESNSGSTLQEQVAYNNSDAPILKNIKDSERKNIKIWKYYYNDKNGNETDTLGKKCLPGQHYYGSSGYDWCTTKGTNTKAYINNNGGIGTKGSTKHAAGTGHIGIWYYFAHYNTKWFNYRYASDDNGRGFIRAQYNGRQCGDNCHWYTVKCKGKDQKFYVYFNYNVSNHFAQKKYRCPKMYVWNKAQQKYVAEQICTVDDLKVADYKNNVKLFKDQVDKKCVGKTSCTQTQATYTINFKYKKQGETEVTEVQFPLTKDKDRVYSEDKSNPALNRTPEVIIRYGGCYADASTRRWYLTEWTFPGTWLPTKGNSRKYGNNPGTRYHFVPGKVCIPTSLSTTNGEWARNYISALANNYKPQGAWKFGGQAYDKPSVTKTSYEGYNIYGEARTFGLFRWTFKISCFYALNVPDGPDVPGDPPTTTECPPNCGGSGEGDIRSVDTADPFLQNASTSKRVQYKNTRQIGFNWTADAKLNGFNDVVGGYNQNPETLLKHIQTTDQFSAKNLDFEFILDTNTLRSLRNEKDYTINEEKIKYENGVSHYTSSFLRKLRGTTKKFTQCNNSTCKVIGGK